MLDGKLVEVSLWSLKGGGILDRNLVYEVNKV